MLLAAHTHSLLIFENLSLGTGDDDLNTQEQYKEKMKRIEKESLKIPGMMKIHKKIETIISRLIGLFMPQQRLENHVEVFFFLWENRERDEVK